MKTSKFFRLSEKGERQIVLRSFLRGGIKSLFFAVIALVLFAGPLLAQALEETDVIPAVLSDRDKSVLAQEKAKLDELRKGLLDDITQQNTECGQVAESNTFQVDLCQNRKEFILSQIQNYKSRLVDYRAKIQKALFMAPQGKSSIQSGLVFKDIPPPVPNEKPASPETEPASSGLAVDRDAPNDPKPTEPQQVAVSSSPVSLPRSVIEYVSNPENHPRVKRAKEDADQFHSLHVNVSKAMLDEANRTIADVRAKTVMKNPRLGREEVDRIVSQDPDVRRMSATWYLAHDNTYRQAQDREEDYSKISKEVAAEFDKKGK